MILIESNKIPKIKKETKRSIRLGSLIQESNNRKLSKKDFNIVSKKNKLSKNEYEDLLFAFKVVKHIKSNAIVLVKNKQTLGIGAGQMNRYDSTRIAIRKYKENFSVKKPVCASDAFFPFTDSLKLLIKNNCHCIITPNGSLNDKKIINFANKNKIKLIFSSIRFLNTDEKKIPIYLSKILKKYPDILSGRKNIKKADERINKIKKLVIEFKLKKKHNF